MTFPESRVFVLVNIYIFFVNNQHCQNASDLCVGGILGPGTQTQLKLKLKRLLHLSTESCKWVYVKLHLLLQITILAVQIKLLVKQILKRVNQKHVHNKAIVHRLGTAFKNKSQLNR